MFPTAFFVQQERERHDIQESRSGAQEKDKADSRSERTTSYSGPRRQREKIKGGLQRGVLGRKNRTNGLFDMNPLEENCPGRPWDVVMCVKNYRYMQRKLSK